MLASFLYVATLVVGLPLWGISSNASVEPQAIPATGPRSDLDTLLWPAADAARRIDQRGATLSPVDLRDRVAVVAFVTPDCSIVCVTRLLDLDRVAKALPAAVRDRVVFLTVSLDGTKAETTALRAFVDGTVGAGTRLRVLAGDPAWTTAIAAMLRYPAALLPEPLPQVMVFDRRGGMAMSYGGDPVDRPRLERDVPLLDSFVEGLDAAPTQESRPL